MGVWAGLESKGWHIEQGPRGNTFQTYYLPPGVSRGPPFKNRVDYGDSRKWVLRHIGNEASEPRQATDAPTPGGSGSAIAASSVPASLAPTPFAPVAFMSPHIPTPRSLAAPTEHFARGSEAARRVR